MDVPESHSAPESRSDCSISVISDHAQGYTPPMERTRCLLANAVLMAAIAVGTLSPGVAAGESPTTPDGVPVAWPDWVSANAPVAVLLWASWVPDAGTTLADLDRISAAARSRGLDLVVVAVQEPIAAARESIGDADVTWFHDRYGDLLKQYRVVSIPILLVLSDDGKVTERIAVTRESLQAWAGE